MNFIFKKYVHVSRLYISNYLESHLGFKLFNTDAVKYYETCLLSKTLSKDMFYHFSHALSQDDGICLECKQFIFHEVLCIVMMINVT